MSTISLICFIYLIMSLKETHSSKYVLMLHEDRRPLELLCWALEQQVLDHKCWIQYVRGVVSLNTQRYFYTIMGEFKTEVTKLLEKTQCWLSRRTTKYKHIHTAPVEAIKGHVFLSARNVQFFRSDNYLN